MLKKIISFILVIIVLITIVVIAGTIKQSPDSANGSKEETTDMTDLDLPELESETATELETLVPEKSEEIKTPDNWPDEGDSSSIDQLEIYDRTGEYEQEKAKSLVNSAIDTMTEFYKIPFSHNDSTSDYTNDLQKQLDTSISEQDKQKNDSIYRVMKEIHMDSQLKGLDIRSAQIVNIDGKPCVSLFGFIDADFKNDKVEKDTYKTAFQAGVRVVADNNRIMNSDIIATYKDPEQVYYKEGSGNSVIHISGDSVIDWDFYDVEGFLTDYQYGFDWDVEETEITEEETSAD